MSTWQSIFPIQGSSSTSEEWDWSVYYHTQCSGTLHIIQLKSYTVLLQITRDGRIVDEGIIRVNNARKEHKARSKGVLATSIINRAIEIEVSLFVGICDIPVLILSMHDVQRKRRGELKKKLELLEKYEMVEKVKVSECIHPCMHACASYV